MNAIKIRWKKLKIWQKVLYVYFSLWLFDLFSSLSRKGKQIMIGIPILLFVLVILLVPPLEDTHTPTLAPYNYSFIQENKQIKGNCSRTEWVYSVSDNIVKEDLEAILYEIYEDKKSLTDRTNISIYTTTAIKNIERGEADISVGFLNDGFNCDNPKIIETKNNLDIYNSTKNL